MIVICILFKVKTLKFKLSATKITLGLSSIFFKFKPIPRGIELNFRYVSKNAPKILYGI